MWQNMQKEPPYKLISFKGHELCFIVVIAVLVGKRDFSIVNGADTMIGYGHPVSIAT
jgi:hypothetical protein